MSEYFKYEKDYGLYAIVGGVEVPVFSASLNAEIGGYTFSIGLPPTMRNTPIKRGTYGALCYTGGVIADGILINEGPLANKGTYSRQLIFRDVPSYVYFMFINLSMFVKKIDDLGPSEQSVKNLYTGLALNNIDLIAGDQLGSFGEKLAQIGAYLSSAAAAVKDETEETKNARLNEMFSKSVAADVYGVYGSLGEARVETTESTSYVTNTPTTTTVTQKKSLPEFILGGLISALGKPNMVPMGSSSSPYNYRQSIGLSRHMTHSGIVQASVAKQFDLAASQILFMNFRDLFMQSNRMESLGALFDQWLTAIGYQKIVVPGKVDNQVIFAPEFPYLIHVKDNDIGSVYSSSTISMGGDVPLTMSIYTTNPYTFPNMVAEGFFGASCGSRYSGPMAAESSVYTYEPSPFVAMSKIGRFKSQIAGISEVVANQTGKNSKESQGIVDWLNGIADHDLYCEAVSQNVVQVTTEKLHLGLIPGFYGKVFMGTNWYGRVKSYDIQFTLDGYSQTIIFDNMITDTMADPETKSSDKDFSVAFWEKGKVRNIGLYTKDSVYASVKTVVKSILSHRRDSSDKIRGPREKEVAAMVASMPVFRKSKFSGDMKNYTKKLNSEGEGT